MKNQTTTKTETDATTELFVWLTQPAREAMPAAWAWCRVAVKINVLCDLSQIVLDYAGVEDAELSTGSGNLRTLSLFAKTTNSCLFRFEDGTGAACYMPLVGVARMAFGKDLASSHGTVAPSDAPLAWARLTLNMNSTVSPDVFRAVHPRVTRTATPCLEWSCEQAPGRARVTFWGRTNPAVQPKRFAPCLVIHLCSSSYFVGGVSVDHARLEADFRADEFKAGVARTASVSFVFYALPDYLDAIAPGRAQLRRQTPQVIDGLPGVWHRLLTATAERRTSAAGALWAPLKSLDLAEGLAEREEKPCKRRRLE